MLRKTIQWFSLGALLGFVPIIASCGKDICVFGQGDCAQELSASTLALASGATTVAASSTLTFTASGGTSPYIYSVLVGGGSVTLTTSTTSTTTVLTAQSTAGTACVRVTDTYGATADRCVTVL